MKTPIRGGQDRSGRDVEYSAALLSVGIIAMMIILLLLIAWGK